VVALTDTFPQAHSHYGWGLMLKLNRLTGIRLTADRKLPQAQEARRHN
jgi:hypothetical protein